MYLHRHLQRLEIELIPRILQAKPSPSVNSLKDIRFDRRWVSLSRDHLLHCLLETGGCLGEVSLCHVLVRGEEGVLRVRVPQAPERVVFLRIDF